MDPQELLSLLREAHEGRDEDLRRLFQRSLPFQDGVFDRWERARRLGFEDGASVYNSAVILEPVRVGASTWIGPNVLLDGSGGGLSVGAFCSISAGVHAYTHDTVLWSLSGGVVDRRTGPVSIGDNCYIGSQSIITAGVTIGNLCVVAANSFVNGDVPDRSIVGGTPARRLGRVEGQGVDVALTLDVDTD